MTQHPTDKLADLISKRHRCLLHLNALGRKQSELIAQGDMGPLLRLLGAKNRVLVAVQAIEQELIPFHTQDPETRSWPTEEARTQCAAQVEQCRRLLEEVLRLEQQNEKTMMLRRDQVASQLQTAQSASTALGAYQAQQKGSSLRVPHTTTFDDSTTKEQQQIDLHSEV